MKRIGWKGVLVAGVAAGMCACQAPEKTKGQMAGDMMHGPLGFIEDGKTTREEVLLKLGVPTADFEGERIMTYRVSYGANGVFEMRPPLVAAQLGTPEWSGVTCSLVLVFDEKNVLRRHSAVPVGSPWEGEKAR